MAEQADRPSRRRRRWPFIFLLALAAVSALLHMATCRRGNGIVELQRRYSALLQARPIAGTKNQRARFYRLQYFLGYPTAVSYAAADLVRRIDHAAPPLRLLAIQVEPGLQDLGFELTIGVGGGRPREVRRRLAVFLGRLRNVSNITLADLSGPGPTTRGGGMRVFTVNGRAELQP
ncbi:MAG TPA: hypothetical protein VF451_07675 [Acidobacteriota bacterium]